MYKAILIFINIIGFLIFTILNVNDIVITHVAPSEIGMYQETEVSIVINKKGGDGFVREFIELLLNLKENDDSEIEKILKGE